MAKKIFSYSSIALILFIIDRLSKNLILKLPLEGVFESKYLNLSISLNPNIAFSLPLANSLATSLAIIITLILIYYLTAVALKNKLAFISLSIIISGAISNIIDRINYGGVIDFINLPFWPSFNLADSYIVIGALLLIFSLKKTYCQTVSGEEAKQDDSR